ncbi:hypothetical protein QTP86_002017 [Hemibagrus guttatus]|nr:hypothetical protein QTP86_002017 [Hemibagrus guttatus]
MHLLLPQAQSGRGELRHRQPRTVGGKAGPRGVEALAGGSQTSVPGAHRSQEPRIPSRADALSPLFTPEENPEVPETILPERVIVSPITWSEETLPPTNASTNTPSGCPPGLKYITRARRTPLIHSTHTSLGTGHLGVNETLSLLKDHFWWPNMASDVRRYVQGCRDCAMSKSPRHLPSGKLLPLPIPNHPWSHLGVDFITDLPVSKYYTCLFVVVDRFSKSCHLIPLKGLPTAMEIAELMFNHIFRYFSIPEDIVSDRGPQFISRVWKAFFSRLGVAVSLSGRRRGRSRRSVATSVPSVTATRTLGASTWIGQSTHKTSYVNHPPA